MRRSTGRRARGAEAVVVCYKLSLLDSAKNGAACEKEDSCHRPPRRYGRGARSHGLRIEQEHDLVLLAKEHLRAQ